MASFRKKQFESPEKDDGPPVMSPPQGGDAKLPDPVADARPPEPIETKSAADRAGDETLRKRLAEMERAEAMTRQAPQQPPPQAQQPQQQPEMPAAVAEWLRRHPEYTNPNDQIAQAEINLATMKCVRDGLNWNDDNFIPSIERHLGMNGHAESRHVGGAAPTPPAPRQEPMKPPPRPAAPSRPMGGPVSAPPTREAPSMATGRAPQHRAPLTRDELEIAASCGQTPEQYAAQKERMNRLKASGGIQS